MSADRGGAAWRTGWTTGWSISTGPGGVRATCGAFSAFGTFIRAITAHGALALAACGALNRATPTHGALAHAACGALSSVTNTHGALALAACGALSGCIITCAAQQGPTYRATGAHKDTG